MSALTPEQARDELLAGRAVRMVVGTGSEDPVLILRNDGGAIVSESVAGWSAGVVEVVCGAERDFLRTYLLGRHALELVAQ